VVPSAGTAVKKAGGKRKPFLIDLYSTAVGKKYVMAITGIMLIGFVIVHMIGNLKMYLGPVEPTARRLRPRHVRRVAA
jgi:succinate dehydrogenase / fumarate reductase, cytochrome b subunit